MTALRFLWAFVVLLLACGAPPREEEPLDMEHGRYTLRVEGGFGSGSYAAGEVVHLWAEHDPLAAVHLRWSGDVDGVLRPGEWHTTLEMPARDVTLRSEQVPRAEVFREGRFLGTRGTEKAFHWLTPPSPRAVLLLLHGTGSRSAFVEKVEPSSLALRFAHEGYAVVAPTSEASSTGDGGDALRWDTELRADNVDFVDLAGLLGWLEETEGLPPELPLVALGMSQGGGMAFALGALSASPVARDHPRLAPVASIVMCSGASVAYAATTTTPSLFLLCSNDMTRQDDAAANRATLGERGIASDLIRHEAAPLHPTRFARVPGIDEAASADMRAELLAGGLLDAGGALAVSVDEVVATIRSAPAAYPLLTSLGAGETAIQVQSQLQVAGAEHQFFSDLTAAALRFVQDEGLWAR